MSSVSPESFCIQSKETSLEGSLTCSDSKVFGEIIDQSVIQDDDKNMTENRLV